MSKFTKILDSGGIIDSSCILDIFEVAEVNTPAADSDGHHPLGTSPVPTDPLKPAGILLAELAVAGIFCMRADPKVLSSIIQPVSVDVIDLHIFQGPHNCLMKPEGGVSPVCLRYVSSDIVSPRVFVDMPRIPINNSLVNVVIQNNEDFALAIRDSKRAHTHTYSESPSINDLEARN